MNLQDNKYRNQSECKRTTKELWVDAFCKFVLGLIVIFLILGIIFFAVRIAEAETDSNKTKFWIMFDEKAERIHQLQARMDSTEASFWRGPEENGWVYPGNISIQEFLEVYKDTVANEQYIKSLWPHKFSTPFKMTWVETLWVYSYDMLPDGNLCEKDRSIHCVDTITHIVTLEPAINPTAPKTALSWCCDTTRGMAFWQDQTWNDFLKMLSVCDWTMEEWLKYSDGRKKETTVPITASLCDGDSVKADTTIFSDVPHFINFPDSLRTKKRYLYVAWNAFVIELDYFGWTLEEWLEYKEQEIK